MSDGIRIKFGSPESDQIEVEMSIEDAAALQAHLDSILGPRLPPAPMSDVALATKAVEAARIKRS